jgi:DNA topoisomerase IB
MHKHCIKKKLQSENLEKVMQSVLALLKGRRVSVGEALRRLSPKCSLLESSVRTYTVCHA